ncbi:ABC-F family ATP-binding cassette domain-containing protein [Nitrosomonas sp. ANs5]|uniref:ABC-F family ATP-binding cassette domain-containing protein n=1 Tax=Nitrosomonas sp. ANs5 TaxID=3423941 RepID=UPI003D33461B
MLTIRNLTFLQNGVPLLHEINLQVFSGQRIGLVGKNGCGKSTLFRLIKGEIPPEQGEIALQAGKTITSVEQEIMASDQSALAFVLDGDLELRRLQEILARDTHDADWFDAQHRFEGIDGYGAQARAAQLLNGLGFAQEALGQPVRNFSGGWRMRLNLARALMCRADLLLLDEPTNHLDLEAIMWLEQYLARYPGSLIMVSHDREFLNACVNRIAHIHDRALDTYSGNYDDFEQARAERIAQQTQAFQQQQQQIAHMEDFVRRFRAKATKAKQAQSRLKALERLVRIAPVHDGTEQYRLKIEAPERGPDLLLQAEGASFSYDSHKIFTDVNLALRAGARVALMGPNGAGKSTLIKLLIGELQPTSGSVSIHPDISTGYFAQHQLEHLSGDLTPLQHMQQLAPKQSELNLRTYLGRFGLAGEDENRPVATFSGGEKSRLAFALLAFQQPHLLLLDEPTNHLDLDMRDALTLALEEYTGAVVLVSHDRSLIRAVADELWLVADGEARPFEGDLVDYRQWLEGRGALMAEKSKPAKVIRKSSPRPNKKALQSRQAKLDASLSAVQAELAAINHQLADPATYADSQSEKIARLDQQRQELETKIEKLEEDWLALELAMEACK